MGRLFVITENTEKGSDTYDSTDDIEAVSDELDLSEFDVDRIENLEVGQEVHVNDGKFTIKREA